MSTKGLPGCRIFQGAAFRASFLVLMTGCFSSTVSEKPVQETSLGPSGREVRQVPLHNTSSEEQLYLLQGPEGALGYLVKMRVRARSGPFPLEVTLDRDFKVKRLEIPSYPWARGREVQQTNFRRQFVDKGPASPIRLGVDVDAVTGATLSSRAAATGVRDAIRLARKGRVEPGS